MCVNDSVADMLTRIRNGITARHDTVLIPASKLLLAVARVLREQGFIADYEVLKNKPQRIIKVTLKYDDKNQSEITGLKRISKPGMRMYVKGSEIPRVYGGLGIAIVSTSRGVMVGHRAWKQNLGGELLCFVW